MGQLAGRNTGIQNALAGSAQSLWMETCEECGAPVTIVAAVRPEIIRCATCAASVPEVVSAADTPITDVPDTDLPA